MSIPVRDPTLIRDFIHPRLSRITTHGMRLSFRSGSSRYSDTGLEPSGSSQLPWPVWLDYLDAQGPFSLRHHAVGRETDYEDHDA
jgi:hypothetical protein